MATGADKRGLQEMFHPGGGVKDGVFVLASNASVGGRECLRCGWRLWCGGCRALSGAVAARAVTPRAFFILFFPVRVGAVASLGMRASVCSLHRRECIFRGLAVIHHTRDSGGSF